MKLPRCGHCLKTVGRKSANGFYCHDPKKMRQVMLVFGYADRPEKTKVHVIVCLSCLDAGMVKENLDLGLKDDQGYQAFLKSKPTPIFEGVEEEAL